MIWLVFVLFLFCFRFRFRAQSEGSQFFMMWDRAHSSRAGRRVFFNNFQKKNQKNARGPTERTSPNDPARTSQPRSAPQTDLGDARRSRAFGAHSTGGTPVYRGSLRGVARALAFLGRGCAFFERAPRTALHPAHPLLSSDMKTKPRKPNFYSKF